MEPDRVDKNSLAAEEPSQPQENLTLPAIAAKADDLDEIKKSVEDAALRQRRALALLSLRSLLHHDRGGRRDP
jgi:hypothetical protein